MKKVLVATLLSMGALAGSANAALPLPTLNVGDTYDVTEVYRITSPQLGPAGYVEVTATATYEVVGVENVTQTNGGATVECYKLSATGTATGTGTVDVQQPIRISGPVKLENGDLAADFFLSKADLSAVKKDRELSGTISYQIAPGSWFTLGQLAITEGEEYVPPMQDHKFPLDAGNSWNQSFTVYAAGVLTVPVLGDSDFSVNIALDAGFTASAGETVLDCDTTKIAASAAGSSIAIENQYCCEANWSLKQKITNLPLGDTGLIERFTIEVTDYQNAAGTCAAGETPTPVLTPTPTPTTPPTGDAGVGLSSPKTSYNAGEDVDFVLSVFNNGATIPSVSLYVLLEVGGGFYFYPCFSDFPCAFASGFDMPTVASPGISVTFLELESPSVPAPLSLTWYAAMLDGQGQLKGSVATLTTTHN